MPIINGKEGNYRFYSFGKNGKRYYYIPKNTTERLIAKNKALKQGRAIKSNTF